MAVAMAKKKNIKGRPKVEQAREPISSFRGSPEFADWFGRLVEYCRIPATSVIELAVIRYAREQGFSEPPPKR